MDFLTVKASDVRYLLERLLSKLPGEYKIKYVINTVCIYVDVLFSKSDYEATFDTSVDPLEQINFYSDLYLATGSRLCVVDASNLLEDGYNWYKISLLIRCDYQIIDDK